MSLYRVRNGQSYLMYSKGALAMYALQNSMGEDRVNRVLNQLVKQYAYPANPPTSLDLIDLFYQEAPEHKGLIDK
jgi:ABC-2 type transport system permease protein